MIDKTIKHEILLLTHGGWGETLADTLTMIIGQIEGVSEIPLNPEDTLEGFLEKVERKVKEMPSNSLIITDISGGTTSNVALKLSQNYDIKILSGLSSIMLIEAIMRQDHPFTDESVNEIKEAALMNCQHLKINKSSINK
ncbi:PTS sugar transporter subunit IIA [Virgibacillus sp. SK37]|uniref:PTS sugar transporter subunit IIA n=1 Tax=Virgibacillus sp. SK37 TaxID=403957 RepID=UPI0004D15103|nr:PTS sugar transporter subunit IIA [Virgibacillus sp. SK37]AIF44532.1 PTS fructose transporter subunit IIA [Virgibacillus sp. SK37]